MKICLCPGVDSFQCQVLGEYFRTGCQRRRAGEETGGQHSWGEGFFAPYDFIKELLHPFHGREQGRPRRPLHRVPAQLADEGAVRVVEMQIGGKYFRRFAAVRIRRPALWFLPHEHVAEQPVRQPARQPQVFPPERQVSHAVIGAGLITRCGYDLETAVEKERMQVRAGALRGPGQRHFAQRLPRPRPDILQRAECRPQVDPDPGLGPVIGGEVNRREARFQAFKVCLSGALPVPRFERDSALRMQGPFLPVSSPAEDPDLVRCSFPGPLQQHLHLAPLLTVFITGFGFRKNQRVVKLHVFDKHGPATLCL